VTVFGIEIEIRPQQLLNALSHMHVNVFGSVTDVRLRQFAKNDFGTATHGRGKLNEASLKQRLKISSPMVIGVCTSVTIAKL